MGVSCRSPRQLTPTTDTTAHDTTSWPVLLSQSLQAFSRGDTLNALALIDTALSKAPNEPALYEIKGYYYYTQKQDSLALWYYKQAIEKGGTSPTLHYKMGTAYLTQQRWKEAYYHLTQALQADSTNGEIWVALGLWAHLQKRLKEAEQYWKKALAFDSTHEKARTFLYDLYLNDFSQPETAKKYYLDPYWRYKRFDPLLNFQLGNYYLHKLRALPPDKGHLKERAALGFQAAQAYTQAILAYPAHAQAYYNRGYVYFLIGKYDKALDDFAKAAELNPQDARAHFMVGSLQEQKRNYEKAKYHYKKAIEIAGSFPEAEIALRELEQMR
ncbi:MAG: tetratricopeptide repeat protein [Bacteroidia bacterium]